MNIGFLQFDPQNRALEKNISLIEKHTKKTMNSFIVLPELFLGSYYDIKPIKSIELNSKLKNLLEHSKNNNLTFVGSLPIRHNKNLFNEGIYIEKGKLIRSYKKRNLFAHEKIIFNSGKKDYRIINSNNYKSFMQICLDNINSKSADQATKKGAKLLFVPATVSVDYLIKIVADRSVRNKIIAIFCNRSGSEKNGINYLGGSSIFLPNGDKLTAEDSPCLKFVEIKDSLFLNN